jgi:hypothetical protein
VPELFLADAARPLLVLHALSAMTLVGSSLHLAVLGALLLVRGRAPTKLIRVHARVAPVAFTTTFALGLIMYPAFRVLVRGVVLDRDAPWASNAFDFKEALVLVGIPIALAIFAAGRRFELPRDASSTTLLGVLGIALGAIVLVAVILGIIVTSVKGP